MQIQIDVPVAPGTPVYVVERCNCGLHYKPNCRQLLGNPTGNAKAIAIVPSIAKSKTNMAYCWKIFVRPFDPSKHLKKWGTSVFKTEKQAQNSIVEV